MKMNVRFAMLLALAAFMLAACGGKKA